MKKYSIGLDFGTLSVRALLIDIHTGEETAVSVYEYPHSVMETNLPTGEKLPMNWALQHPQDYLEGLEYTIKDLLKNSNVLPENIIGIGVDFTSSTVISVYKDGTPLCCTEKFCREPHAYVKLWKHHGAEEEAAFIDQVAKDRGEQWLELYGGKVSSEWLVPKVLETLRKAPEVYHETDRFMEALDWIIWKLTGQECRSACGIGYKAFYHHEKGYPSNEFFKALHPEMEYFVKEKMEAPIKGVGECAGYLTMEMAELLGLKAGTPIAAGIVDAHASVPGSGVSHPGEMMIIMGTSSCHLLLSDVEAGIPGVCGIVKDGIMPGCFGYEAGQCCVGDHFAWFVKNCVPETYVKEAEELQISVYQLLADKLKGYKAGQSGLLALDWFNGVRSPLMDFNLNGLIIGMNLQTKPEEIYLALIEATAFGTKRIVEQFENAGIIIDTIVVGGGIPAQNPLAVQVYADVLQKEIKVSGTDHASALGAAILGAAAASEEITGYKNANEIAEKIGKIRSDVYSPRMENKEAYELLYQEYKTLSCYFGEGENSVMKRLNKLRERKR